MFCSGSKTSSKLLAGSPFISLVILSISSIKKTGFLDSHFLNALIILPGLAPIYVLLWPIISAGSFTPPTEILANFLLVAIAIDFASDVLPTPGGPTRQIIGAF